MERIDYILIDSSLVQFSKRSEVLPAFSSDHAIPVLELLCSVAPPGPGYWKLNISLLDDEKFITEVIEKMTEILTDTSMDLFDRWELMKFAVKQQAIRRSKEISRSDKNKITVLRNKLQNEINMRDKLPLDASGSQVKIFHNHNEQINLLSCEIDKILTKRTEAAMIRFKANWYEFSEKSSRYFFALEKHRYNRKTIHRLYDIDGNLIDDPNKILDLLNEYFKNL